VRRLVKGLIPLAAAALAGCTDAGAPTSTPYVQDVGATRARIALQTRHPAALEVAIGPEGGPLGEPVQEAGPAHAGAHEVRFTGLAPDTRYRYRATGAGGRVLGESTFRTAPLPGTRAITFAALGDSGATDLWKTDDREAVKHLLGNDRRKQGRQGEVATGILARGADLVLHVGDVVYPDGAIERYQNGFFDPMAPLIASTPMFAALGDHDIVSRRGAAFFEVFHLPESDAGGESFYSFDWGDVHFVALDSEIHGLKEGGPQLDWLDEDLGATRLPWKVVFFQSGVLTKRAYAGDLDALEPRLAAHGVQLVLNGNDHLYRRFAPRGGVLHVTTGAGGMELVPVDDQPYPFDRAESVHGFVVGTADRSSMTIEAVDLAGKVFDTVVLRRE